MRVLILILPLALAGCITNGSTQSLKPVCDAIIGPIQYSSHNKQSARYAGPELAPDLAKRNRVGVNLACPAYK